MSNELILPNLAGVVLTGNAGKPVIVNPAGDGFLLGTEVDLTSIATSVISDTDNTDDLGSASKAWKDLYLAGGIYIGGTTSANYLTDYEEGTWTAVFRLGANDNSSGGDTGATYAKIGKMVFTECDIAIDNSVTGTGTWQITGLPFTSGALNTVASRCEDDMDATNLIGSTSGAVIHYYAQSTSTVGALASKSNAHLGTAGKRMRTSATYST